MAHPHAAFMAAIAEVDDVLEISAAGNAPALVRWIDERTSRAGIAAGDAARAAAEAVVRTRQRGDRMLPLLVLVCEQRAGGAGVSGWLGCLVVALNACSDTVAGDVAAFVTGYNPWTALHAVVTGRKRDAASEAQRLAAVAALLVYGADATAKDNTGWSHRTPRDWHMISNKREPDADICRLLEDAEHVGGRAAVASLLAGDRAISLTAARGFDLVLLLPRVRALVVPRMSRRVLVAQWSDGRRRARDGAAPRSGNALLRVLESLPRAALLTVLQQAMLKSHDDSL